MTALLVNQQMYNDIIYKLKDILKKISIIKNIEKNKPVYYVNDENYNIIGIIEKNAMNNIIFSSDDYNIIGVIFIKLFINSISYNII